MTSLKNNTIMDSVKRNLENSRFEKYDYESYMKNRIMSEDELNRQRLTTFEYAPLISVMTEIGNEPVKYLGMMIESVMCQTYGNLELCISDNSSGEEAGNIISQYINKDSRIRYVRTKSTYGCGGRYEEALNMAVGDFVMCVGANDEISSNTLFEFIKIINNRDRVDIIYADEDLISSGKKRYEKPIFKPNMNYELMRTHNYIGMPMLVRKSLANRVGGFSDRYQTSALYDFTLRCIEGTEKVKHIAKMLYHRRNAEAELSNENDIKVIEDHLDRVGVIADVEELESPGYYRIKYHLESTPHITVVINDVGDEKALKKCINSIRGRTIYREYDVLVNKNDCKLTSDQIEGDFVLAINSSFTVSSNNFIEKMLARISQGDVAAVCGKVIDRHRKIRHAGIKYSKGSLKYMFYGMPSWQYGYCRRAILQQNVDAFPAFGVMLKKEDYLNMDYDRIENGIDATLCRNLSKSGKIFTFEPNVVFTLNSK